MTYRLVMVPSFIRALLVTLSVMTMPGLSSADVGGVLTLPAYGPFNGNLNQLNVAEIINHQVSAPASLRITVVRDSGETVSTRDISVPAGGVSHIIVNEFIDAQGRGINDSYGLIKIEKIGSADPIITAHTSFYKLPAGSQTPEFAFVIPFQDAQVGQSFGMYNSINPGIGGQPVANFISIANPATSLFTGALQLYNQDGSAGTRSAISIPSGGRMDFPAGHPNGMVTGTFEIIPDSGAQPYISFSARYAAADLPGNYNFGFSLATHPGSCNETLPASTMGYGTNNWVEIGNLGSTPKSVTVEVRSRNGTLAHSQVLEIPARGQGNFHSNPHIGDQNVGSVKVVCSPGDPILVQSAFYSRPSEGSPVVTSAYVSQARGLTTAGPDDRLVTAVNTYLGDFNAANWLKVANESSLAAPVNFVIRSAAGAIIHQSTINIVSNGSADFDVHTKVGDNFYGSVAISSPTIGVKLRAELLRVFLDGAGQIAKVIPVPASFVSNTAVTGEIRPIAESQSVQTNENVARNITLQGSDPTNLPLTYEIVRGPLNGALSGSGRNLRYTPANHFVGADSFVFRVNNGSVNSAHSTVSINVTALVAEFNGNARSLLPYRPALSIKEAQHMLNNAALADGQALAGLGSAPNRATLINNLLALPDATNIDADAITAITPHYYIPGDNPTARIWTTTTAQVYLLHYLRNMNPVAARMTLFWHNHFATSLAPYSFNGLTYRWMKLHIDLLTRNALGSFEDLSKGYTRDQAGADWLTNTVNNVYAPNENYGREFLELFNLGAEHLITGEPNYTEDDVVRGATRALSGYSTVDVGGIYFVAWSPYAWMQDPANPVNIPIFQDRPFAASRPFVSSPQVDDFSEYVLYNHPAAAEYIGVKIFMAITHIEPDLAMAQALGNRLRNSGYDIKDLLSLILNSSAMYSPEARRGRVEGPAEKFLKFFRRFDLPLVRHINGGTTVDVYGSLRTAIVNSGMDLLNPPTVFGWADADYVKRAGIIAKGGSWILPQQGFGQIREMNNLISSQARLYEQSNAPANWKFTMFLPAIPANTPVGDIPNMVLSHFENKFGTSLTPAKRARFLYYLTTVMDTAPANGVALPAQGNSAYRAIVWNPALTSGNGRWSVIVEQKISGLLYLFLTLPETNL